MCVSYIRLGSSTQLTGREQGGILLRGWWAWRWSSGLKRLELLRWRRFALAERFVVKLARAEGGFGGDKSSVDFCFCF